MSKIITTTVDQFLIWLRSIGYLEVKALSHDRWAAISPMLYTHAIVTGIMHDEHGYDDRWCYITLDDARRALEQWDCDCTQEPSGWTRHPASGRRRPEGDPTKEYINP